MRQRWRPSLAGELHRPSPQLSRVVGQQPGAVLLEEDSVGVRRGDVGDFPTREEIPQPDTATAFGRGGEKSPTRVHSQVANDLAMAMMTAFGPPKLGGHVEVAEGQASALTLRGESPIVPAEADPARRRGIVKSNAAGPMVPQPDGLVTTVAGQEVSRVAERRPRRPPVVADQDLRLTTGQPVPDVDLEVVARGRQPFSVRMPRQSLDKRGGQPGPCRSSARLCDSSFKSRPDSRSKSRTTGGSMAADGQDVRPWGCTDTADGVMPTSSAASSRPVPRSNR